MRKAAVALAIGLGLGSLGFGATASAQDYPCSQVKLVVLDLSASPIVDLQSAHALAGLADEITAGGIRFQVVEARSSVRDRLRHEGVDSKLGGVNRFTSVADAVATAGTGIDGQGGSDDESKQKPQR